MVYFEEGDSVQNSFFCHDCKSPYDIINHAEVHHKEDIEGYLKKLSKGKKVTTQVVKAKPTKIQDFKKLKEISGLTTELHSDTLEWLESRGISKETADAYGITGSDSGCHFNYYVPVDEDYRLVFLKARVLGDVPNGKDKYFCVAGGNPVLYGMHLYVAQAILVITEGEVDCVSFYEGISFAGMTDKVIVCSVPTGTSHTWVESCKSFIEKFKMVVIVSDSDEAGVKFREVCFQKISYHDNVRWIDMEQMLPTGKKLNDVNDYLRLYGKQKVAQLLSKIEVPHHDCGTSASKTRRVSRTGHIKTGFFGLDRVLSGLKLSNLSLLAGESNDGKSTIGRQIIGYMAKNKVGIGCMMGEETDECFMDSMIRQQYHEDNLYNKAEDDWGDTFFTPKAEVEERWKHEFGEQIGLFQISRVRQNDSVIERLCEWISHGADVEGKTFFFIDNLMKITAEDSDNEFAAQAKVIEELYKLATKKQIHIMLVTHTKKIEGLINDNSISGSKKLINTPDVILAFQRADRLKSSRDMTKDAAIWRIATNAGLVERPTKEEAKGAYVGPEFTSYINCFKIRDRKSTYTRTVHCLKYDARTQLSFEQLPSEGVNKSKLYEDGYSVILPNKPQIKG
jgi:hypothetical protein